MRTRSLAGLSLACILVSARVDAQEPIQQTVVVTRGGDARHAWQRFERSRS